MATELRGGPGRLRTYLGIAPGAGKTYAMLRDARAERRAGVDAVVAYWERHGRPATAAQIGDLELLPRRTVSYGGTSFEELDLIGVLERRPELAVVDELAHANPPGDRHDKRWQDVEELLSCGIDVYTTLNVTNIESLGRIVSQITGKRRAEPVPDGFLRAGEVKLVQLEPAALRQRLARGLVFPDDQTQVALADYFQYANLAALLELTQLWLDNSVADPAAAYISAHGIAGHRGTQSVIVGLDGSTRDEWLIRYAADLARLSDATLQGVHVRTGGAPDERERAQLEADRRLLEELGGSFVSVRASDVGIGLTDAVGQAADCQLVIGSSTSSRWSRLFKSSTVGRILEAAGDMPCQVVNLGRQTSSPPTPRSTRTRRR